MTNNSQTAYGTRSALVQALCPAPKRHLQRLVLIHGLKTGLDIGCGQGSPLTSLRGPRFKSTGIDIDARSIQQARAKDLHDEYVVGDFMTMKLEHAYDVVVLSHVLEHFDRDTGWRVLQNLEQISRHLVYVETPNGFLEQTDYDGNPFMRHLSGWFAHDFQSRGYTVYGSGPKWLCVPMGRKTLMPSALRQLLSRMLQWYYFRRPKKAGTISGIRFVDRDGNLRSA
jgi:ubiquinone/menaquinone biosynthesis C-methylase UbiE